MQTDEVWRTSKCLKSRSLKGRYNTARQNLTQLLPSDIESPERFDNSGQPARSAVSNDSRSEEASPDRPESKRSTGVVADGPTEFAVPTSEGCCQAYYLSGNGPNPVAFPYWIQPVVVPVGTALRFDRPINSNEEKLVYSFAPVFPHPMPVLLIPLGHPVLEAPASLLTASQVLTSGSSVNSDVSAFSDFPTVLIERNAFKHWFEGNRPDMMEKLPFKLKRYKSVETFTHWLESRKRFESSELNVLIKVTDVWRLLAAVKSAKNLRILAYEHLFDPTQKAGKSARVLLSEADSLRKDFDPNKLTVCTCLEQAFRKLLIFYGNQSGT
jgi:hypothetical protein